MSQAAMLDLTRCHFEHRRGDLTVFGTWFGVTEPEPALVLCPTNGIGKPQTTTVTVPLSHAWIWSEEIGDPIEAAKASAMSAQMLGLPHSVMSAMRVMSIVREHLGDLMTIPPAPSPDKTQVVADVVATDRESGRRIHAEITEPV